jgi:diguanylate cyclase (GGDEF)-like protein/PAS domain S-box-containing protein
MAINNKKTQSFARSIWLSVSILVIVIFAFSIYVWSEKQIDLAHEMRVQSLQLTVELHESSDELTRMVRTYVTTGDPIYKKHFQEILDIRNGIKPRPENYQLAYWDLHLYDKTPAATNQQKIALLDLMQQAGFTKEEFSKLAQAKSNSDALTSIEFKAMELVENAGPDAETNRAKAIAMVHDKKYHEFKAKIMKPISETMIMVDQRTLNAVNTSANIALFFRLTFAAFAILLVLTLKKTYAALKTQLGGTVDEVRAQIANIGTNTSSPLVVADGMEDSVLGWLAKKQDSLIEIERENKEAEARLISNESYLRTIFENEPECIKVIDSKGILRKMNPAGLAMVEADSIDELSGDTLLSIVTPNYRAEFTNMLRRVIAGETVHLEFEIIGLKGTHRWLETHAVLMQDSNERMLLGVTRDITERKMIDQSLAKNKERFRLMLETSPIAVRITSAIGSRVLFANERYAKLINTEPDQMTGKDPKQYYADPQVYEDILKELNNGNSVTEKLVELNVPGGLRIWAIASYRLIDYENESAVLGWFYDVTELRTAQESLRISEQLAKRSLAELKYQKFALDKHAIVAISDVKGLITYANVKFCEISGYSQEELLGQDHAILNSGYHPHGFFKEMYRIISKGGVWHNEVCNRAKDGHLYWVDTTVAPFIGENGKPESYISIRTDISSRKAAEEKSSYLALYDPLTKLPNRRLLLDRLNHAMIASARSGHKGAILFLDLDHFKKLNDTLGHDIGDLLLQQVAERILACVRESDTASRLGGDEFVIMLDDLSPSANEAVIQTENIGEKILKSLNQPYQLGIHTYYNSPSIGATLFSGNTIDMEDVLKQADIAMYEAKTAGRNAIRFFDPQMQAAIEANLALEADLRVAINEQQFKLLYQAQVYHNGGITGAEVLIRWHHPERGMVPPFEFIPLAEETGLIVSIGLWVLETACAQIKQWENGINTQHLQLAVNVSARQFYEDNFVAQVQKMLNQYGINPSRLKLELTESLVLDDINGTINKMNELRTIGVRFSMDDFGTGQSSLAYLTQLPLDQLKIDQSFVRNIGVKNTDAVIVQTIIGMGNNLGMEVIAEGVETEEQRAFLQENGCAICQGYLFSKPVSLEEFEALLNKSTL